MALAVAAMDVRALPVAVVAKAKLCILDALSGCFALPADRRVAAALAATAYGPARHGCVIVGQRQVAGAADAAFVNAVQTAAAETNDTHPSSAVHPGMVVIPAVLAAAETAGCAGGAVIEGVVAGYETMCRVARAVVTPELVRIFRSTGLVGPTGAAFGAARVLGLSPEAMANAASLATQTASGFNEWAGAGTDEHVFHAGFAARNGVTAALLAASGVTAATSVLDGKSGFLAAFATPERKMALTERLGESFEILRIVHKPAPACFFVQTPAQVAERIARSTGFDPSDIETVEIRTTRAAAEFPGCNNPGPMRTRQDASMSIQFGVAAVLLSRRIAHANWEKFTDPAANALAARSRIIVDESPGRDSDGEAGASVTVRHRSGHLIEDGERDFRSMTRAAVIERFLELSRPHIGEKRAADVVGVIDRLDTVASIDELTDLLAAGPLVPGTRRRAGKRGGRDAPAAT